MARYRKRPVVVEAMQWTGSNIKEMIAFAGFDFCTVDPEDRGDDPDATAQVFVAANGVWIPVVDGEWIIRDAKGFYPHADSLFAANYERVEDDDA